MKVNNNKTRMVSVFFSMSGKLLNDNIRNLVGQRNSAVLWRYFFALNVLFVHTCVLTCNKQWVFLNAGVSVKAFFALAGFFVAYSYLRRDNVREFAHRRFFRIYPAYFAVIVFCFVLGACISEIPLTEFLSSWQTWKYAICNMLMLNWLEPTLPGVFASNPYPWVDGALWTMKFEVLFYCLIPCVVWLMRRVGVWRVLIPLMTMCIIGYDFLPIQGQDFTIFFGGMTVLFAFDRIWHYRYVFLVTSFLLVIISSLTDIQYLTLALEALQPVTYPIVFIGLAYFIPMLKWPDNRGNVTYGLYMIHFPVIQLCISLQLSFVATLFTTAVVAFILAVVLREFIEKRFK